MKIDNKTYDIYDDISEVKCPHCGHKMDFNDNVTDGFLEDDEEYCEECDEKYEFFIEFSPYACITKGAD